MFLRNTDLNYFQSMKQDLDQLFLHTAVPVEVEQWHAQNVVGNPELISHELQHMIINIDISTPHKLTLIGGIKPNLPWAEDQFQERVSGEPLNPPPSEAWWPYAQQGNAAHKAGEVFSHSYPERYWPRFAAIGSTAPNGRQIFVPHMGIRYEYGDLTDVIELLNKYPLTRQAYLPVFFPEDTGAVDGQRIPCSLGYHFLQRRGIMDVTYFIRSCDYMRHFTDDVYMTARLLQWVCEKTNTKPGFLIMHIGSFHVFKGDIPVLKARVTSDKKELYNDNWY